MDIVSIAVALREKTKDEGIDVISDQIRVDVIIQSVRPLFNYFTFSNNGCQEG